MSDFYSTGKDFPQIYRSIPQRAVTPPHFLFLSGKRKGLLQRSTWAIWAKMADPMQKPVSTSQCSKAPLLLPSEPQPHPLQLPGVLPSSSTLRRGKHAEPPQVFSTCSSLGDGTKARFFICGWSPSGTEVQGPLLPLPNISPSGSMGQNSVCSTEGRSVASVTVSLLDMDTDQFLSFPGVENSGEVMSSALRGQAAILVALQLGD